MRRPRPSEDDFDEDDEPTKTGEVEPVGRQRRRARPRRGGRALRPWSSSSSEVDSAPSNDEEPEEPAPSGLFHRPREPVFFRASDAWWFEPLVALAIVALLLIGLFAYTQNWPPVYVVESKSMQHGSTDEVGLINTGDLVLAEKISTDQIVPYLAGSPSGYRTYGEFGDVLLYHPLGTAGSTPIIHRAIAFIEANPNGTYSIPELAPLPCGASPGAAYRVSGSPNGCGSNGLRGTLTLLGIGWAGATVTVPLASLGNHSGFLTLGDNNLSPGNPPSGIPDQPAVVPLVQSDWIVGVARGMIPWFGALKLLLTGGASEVPGQSWEWLGLSVIGLFLVAIGIHYALRAEGIEDDRRKEREREEREDSEREEPPRRRWKGLTRWSPSEDEDLEEEEAAEMPRRRGPSLLTRFIRPRREVREPWGGRPRPRVGRGLRGRGRPAPRRRRRDDEDDL